MASSILSRTAGTTDEDDVTRVYRYAVRKTAIDAVEAVAAELELGPGQVRAAIDQLVAGHLLRVAGDPPDQLIVPVDPDIAGALLVSPMEREIYQRREQIALIREWLEVFRQDYARSGRPPADFAPVRRVDGAVEVRGYLKVAGDECGAEVLALQPGRPDSRLFDDFLGLCGELLGRGISVRIVCQHRCRADLTTRMKIKAVADAGALVRTASHMPRAAVIFDRSVAVLLGAEDGDDTAARVRDDDVVAFLLDVFNHVWDAATPLASFDTGYAEVADDLQNTIVGLMAAGLTDEALARKLGMSVRTCRRHIAAMMRDLDAVSRFQAGVRAARRGSDA